MKKSILVAMLMISIGINASEQNYSYFDFLNTYKTILGYRFLLSFIGENGMDQMKASTHSTKINACSEKQGCIDIKSKLFDAIKNSKKSTYQLTQEFAQPLAQCKKIDTVKQKNESQSSFANDITTTASQVYALHKQNHEQKDQ